MRFLPNERLSFQFTDAERTGIVTILDKFPGDDYAESIRCMIMLPGKTVLTVTQALVLAGLLLPWYEFLSQRIIQHPGIFTPPNTTSSRQRSWPVVNLSPLNQPLSVNPLRLTPDR